MPGRVEPGSYLQVAALRAILCVSEHARHEVIPERSRCRGANWFPFRLGRKTISRQRRYNYVARIFWRTAKTCRVAKWSDSFQKLEHRSRPSMCQDKRHRLRPTSFYVVKVDIVVVHTCDELRIPIQNRFRFAPVVLLRPIVSERLHVIPIGPVPPIVPVESVWELRFPHAIEYPGITVTVHQTLSPD